MWEVSAAPPPPTAPPAPQRRDWLLPVQLLLCALVLGAVLGAKLLGLPVYARLRVAYTAAVTAREDGILGQERRFARFAQQAAGAFGQAAAEAWAGLFGADAPPAGQADEAAFTAVSARVRRGRAAPDGASLQSYRPPFALTFPLAGGYVPTSGYGWRTEPITGKGTAFHKGADLAAAEGTPVLAAAGGVVRTAGKSESYGNYLRVLHAGGDETLYAHMQYLFVHAGQSVAAGQQLGTVGQTGRATGPHLHFELLHEGVRYDPAGALQAAQ